MALGMLSSRKVSVASVRSSKQVAFSAQAGVARPWQLRQARNIAVFAEPDTDLMSESDRKKADAERLRKAEKFMVIGGGNATCKGCGYEYNPDKGDPEFPVPRGTQFADLPEDYVCPICGSNKDKFESRVKVVAGFAENQGYGLGTNSMTGDQKQLLIYGSLAAFFALFIAGYGLQ